MILRSARAARGRRSALTEAWVTLATTDAYAVGCLVLGHSLRRVGTTRQTVVMITSGVSDPLRSQLSCLFDSVTEVDVMDSADHQNLNLLGRPDLSHTYTKLHAWRLTQYDKCVFLDADTLMLDNCDELFDREELSAAPDAGWPDCFNSGVFVYTPSSETYRQLVHFASTSRSFDGGDQGLLNSFFSNWATQDIHKHLPFTYNVVSQAFYSYLPAFTQFHDKIRIVHFIGAVKPWHHKLNAETGSVSVLPNSGHSQEFLQIWWNLFMELVRPYLDPCVGGLVSELTQVRTGDGEPLPLVLDDRERRLAWERGHADYMGVDCFSSIMRKLDDKLTSPPNSSSSSMTADGNSTFLDGNACNNGKPEVMKSLAEECGNGMSFVGKHPLSRCQANGKTAVHAENATVVQASVGVSQCVSAVLAETHVDDAPDGTVAPGMPDASLIVSMDMCHGKAVSGELFSSSYQERAAVSNAVISPSVPSSSAKLNLHAVSTAISSPLSDEKLLLSSSAEVDKCSSVTLSQMSKLHSSLCNTTPEPILVIGVGLPKTVFVCGAPAILTGLHASSSINLGKSASGESRRNPDQAVITESISIFGTSDSPLVHCGSEVVEKGKQRVPFTLPMSMTTSIAVDSMLSSRSSGLDGKALPESYILNSSNSGSKSSVLVPKSKPVSAFETTIQASIPSTVVSQSLSVHSLGIGRPGQVPSVQTSKATSAATDSMMSKYKMNIPKGHANPVTTQSSESSSQLTASCAQVSQPLSVRYGSSKSTDLSWKTRSVSGTSADTRKAPSVSQSKSSMTFAAAPSRVQKPPPVASVYKKSESKKADLSRLSSADRSNGSMPKSLTVAASGQNKADKSSEFSTKYRVQKK